jgi:phosphohistidine phosphatase SixA
MAFLMKQKIRNYPDLDTLSTQPPPFCSQSSFHTITSGVKVVSMVRTIDVIFVRHAESEGNVKEAYCCEAINALSQFQVPTSQQITETLKMLNYNFNSELSDLGKRQAVDMNMILSQEKLWDDFQFDLCVYSPLNRTKETCLTIIPTEFHSKCMSLKCLEEITPSEHLLKHYLVAKLNEFEHWLVDAPVSKLVIVGHSQYFKKMFKLKSLMRNCDVWRSTATIHSSDNATPGRCQWSEPVLLHRTELAIPHPLDNIFNANPSTGHQHNPHHHHPSVSTSSAATSVDEGDNGDLDNNRPEEISCRICQVSEY